MVTGILAIVTAFVGLAVIIAGVWGAVVLMAQKADTPVPFRYLRNGNRNDRYRSWPAWHCASATNPAFGPR